jgi:PAS domain S-box-containing protein
MKFDFLTLFAITAFTNIGLAIVIGFYVIKVAAKKWYLITYLASKTLESAALIAIGFRNIIPDVFTVELAMTVYYISIFLNFISIVSYKGSLKKKFAYKFGTLSFIFAIGYLITAPNEKLRAIFSAFTFAFLYFYGSIQLYKERKPYNLPNIVVTGFVIYATAQTIRGFQILNSTEIYHFASLSSWDLMLILTGIVALVISTFGYLLLLKEVDESIIFKQYHLNKVAFDQSPISIVITDTEGTIEYVNSYFTELTGYTLNEAKEKNLSLLNSDSMPNETRRSIWEYLQKGNIWYGEFSNEKKNKDIYFEEAVIAPIKDENQDIINYISIKSDITKRKQDQEIILNRNNELYTLNATKDRMFSIIAHDLKSPIGSIVNLVEYIELSIYNENYEKAKIFLKSIKEYSKNTSDLLDNLLHWARSQINAVNVNFEYFDLKIVIDQTLSLLSNSMKQKNIAIFKTEKNESIVYADLDMIKTVLRNLISNAIKFTPNNGIIAIEIVKKERTVVLSIQDTGIGIEKDRIEKLFCFLENKSTYGTGGEKGTGLGLVLAHDFILKNNGKMWVESDLGVGSTFYFSLQATKQEKS